MSYEIKFSKQYEKRLRQFLSAHPQLINQYEKTMRLLKENPFHPSLRLHKLSGPLAGIYSASINRQYRLTLEFQIEGGCIIPIDIGSHDRVY